MRPKRHIMAGWAMGLSAIFGGAVTIPAIADKAADQRASVVLTRLAADFRATPEPVNASVSVDHLSELYGPDSRADTALEALSVDLAEIEADYRDPVLRASVEQAEINCLAEAVYYEARSEPRAGQIAVAQVVQNRVRSKHFPNTYCGVVYEGSERRTGCQFTFTCDGSLDREPKGRSWENAELVASYVLTQQPRSTVGRSTHYHTTAVDPVWNDSLERTRLVGSHIFYRFPWRERPVGSHNISVAPPS